MSTVKKGLSTNRNVEGNKHGIERRDQHQRDRDGKSGFDMGQGAEHRIEMQKDWPVQYQGEKEQPATDWSAIHRELHA